jgi:hypothetical protein
VEKQMRGDRKRGPEFGKRGLEQIEPTERAPTVLERLKQAGLGWWSAGAPRKTTSPRSKGVRPVRLDP